MGFVEFSGLRLGGRCEPGGGAACKGEGWLAAACVSLPEERGVASPAQLFVCVHTALACMGGRGVGGGTDRGVVGTRVGPTTR